VDILKIQSLKRSTRINWLRPLESTYAAPSAREILLLNIFAFGGKD